MTVNSLFLRLLHWTWSCLKLCQETVFRKNCSAQKLPVIITFAPSKWKWWWLEKNNLLSAPFCLVLNNTLYGLSISLPINLKVPERRNCAFLDTSLFQRFRVCSLKFSESSFPFIVDWMGVTRLGIVCLFDVIFFGKQRVLWSDQVVMGDCRSCRTCGLLGTVWIPVCVSVSDPENNFEHCDQRCPWFSPTVNNFRFYNVHRVRREKTLAKESMRRQKTSSLSGFCDLARIAVNLVSCLFGTSWRRNPINLRFQVSVLARWRQFSWKKLLNLSCSKEEHI